MVVDMDFSPNGNSLAVAYQNGSFGVLNFLTGRFLKIGLENDNTRGAHAICFVSNKQIALSAQSDTMCTTFKIWTYDLRDGGSSD
jgi:WD40 repeat protein